jgi:hypothetical protein
MTVQDLLTALAAMPPNATVVIDDTDTAWMLNVQSVELAADGLVHLAGDYGDQFIPAGQPPATS